MNKEQIKAEAEKITKEKDGIIDILRKSIEEMESQGYNVALAGVVMFLSLGQTILDMQGSDALAMYVRYILETAENEKKQKSDPVQSGQVH